MATITEMKKELSHRHDLLTTAKNAFFAAAGHRAEMDRRKEQYLNCNYEYERLRLEVAMAHPAHEHHNPDLKLVDWDKLRGRPVQ